jgi:hypothetical protein
MVHDPSLRRNPEINVTSLSSIDELVEHFDRSVGEHRSTHLPGKPIKQATSTCEKVLALCIPSSRAMSCSDSQEKPNKQLRSHERDKTANMAFVRQIDYLSKWIEFVNVSR